jgi:hypothetical protein
MTPKTAKARPKAKLYSEAGYKEEIIIWIGSPVPATINIIRIFLFTPHKIIVNI